MFRLLGAFDAITILRVTVGFWLKVSLILKKAETERTEAERTLLHLSPGIVDDIVRRGRSRQVAKERQLEVISKVLKACSRFYVTAADVGKLTYRL